VAEKRLSIRLAAVDGKIVEQTLKDIGETGERAFQRISTATAPANADLKALDTTARALNSVFRQAAGLVAAYASVQGAIGAFRSITETSMAFQGLDTALNAVTGSSQGAADEMAFLEKESDRLGLNLLETSKAYLGLAAASKGTKLEGKATREIFSAVAEAATVLQMSTEDTAGSLKAIGQMMSKGNVQAEELRGQVGDRLYGAFQMAARGMGITTAELDKLLQEGKVLPEVFLPRLTAEVKKTFGGGIELAAQSARAEMNRLTNSVIELERTASVSGFMDGLTTGFKNLAATLSDPEVKDAAVALGKALGETITVASEALGFLVQNAGLAVNALGGLIIARTVAAGFTALNAALATSGTIASLKLAAELSTGLALRLAVLGGATQLATLAMVGLRTALAFIGGPVGLAVLAGLALVKLAAGHDVAAKAAKDHAAELAELEKQANGTVKGLTNLSSATQNEAMFKYEEQLRTARENIVALKDELRVGPIGNFWDQITRNGTELQDELVAIRQDFINGRLTVDQYSDALFALARKFPDFGKQAESVKEMVLTLHAAELAATRAQAAMDTLRNPKPTTPEAATPAKPTTQPLADADLKRIQEQIADLAAEERGLRRVAAARKDGEAAVRSAMIANEQEQTLRRLGLATGKQEDAQREGLAGKIRGLVANVYDLHAAEKQLSEQERKNTDLEKERQKTVDDVRQKFDALDKTLAGATRRATEWRDEALKGLSETSAGYEAFRAEVDAVFNQMLKDARDEDLKNSRKWQDGVIRALNSVTDEATNAAAHTEKLFKDAFSNMEDALVSFVQTGKLDFTSLANSIIADLIRMQIQASITGPLSSAISAGIGSFFGSAGTAGASSAASTPAITPSLAHTGGVIGADALASRTVSASLFADAPRFHTGGVVGKEMPIIAKQGETVFTPGQMAALGGALQSQPQVSVMVNIQNTSSAVEAKTETSRDNNGNVTLTVLIEEVENQMARNVSRGNGLAPTLERRYGLNPAAGSYR
jgi:tape measure domain-containing protein